MFTQFTNWLQTLPPDQQVMVIGIIVVAVLVGGGALVWFLWTHAAPRLAAIAGAFMTPVGLLALILLLAVASPTPIPLPWGGSIGGGGLAVNVPPELGEAVSNMTSQAQPVVVGASDSRLRYLQDLQSQNEQARRILSGLTAPEMITNTVSMQKAVDRALFSANLAVNEPRLSAEVWGQLFGYAQWLQDKSQMMVTAKTIKEMPQGINTAISRLADKAPEVQGADRKCEALPIGRITSQAEWERETYRLYTCGELVGAQIRAEKAKPSPSQSQIDSMNKQMETLGAMVSRLDLSWAAYQATNPLTTPAPVTTPTRLP